jgi:RimJ/RimL family protein N-acetyltransferase
VSDAVPWPLSDRVVSLRPPRAGEEQVLVAGRDAEWERWLGPGEAQPRPTAVVLVGGKIVGWVDYDTDRDWLGPHEVNVGYNVFAPYRRRGYATRAVRLLFALLRDHTDHQRANLVIDVGNIASLGVARAVGAQVVQSNFDEAGRLSSLRHLVDLADFSQASLARDGRKSEQPRPS